jgi:hypothetical protein
MTQYQVMRACFVAIVGACGLVIVLAVTGGPVREYDLTCHSPDGSVRTLRLVGSYGFNSRPARNEAPYFFDRNGKHHLAYAEVCR